MSSLFSGFSGPRMPTPYLGGTHFPLLASQRSARFHAQAPRSPARKTDRLFLAALPDRETAERISDLARRLRIGHELRGKLIRPEHFHVTLHHVADDVVPPPGELVDAILQRLSDLTMPSFRVAFDRVGSFKNGAFVLRGDESLIGLEVLQQRVSDALDARPAVARPFTPHVTLLRDGRRVEEHDIEPIEWKVKEVVLVHSLLGRTTHRHVARLPLRQGARF
jgi:RNA 2',3'-cyclic 3'-phosphodiesterase